VAQATRCHVFFRAERVALAKKPWRTNPGINKTYLSTVERSERNVSIDNIARIGKGLGTDPWKLLKDN
jgi:hypothetical protein